MSEQQTGLRPLPVISYVDDWDALLARFQSYLQARGHTPRTVQLYVMVAAHFTHWLRAARPERQRVDTQLALIFLQEYLPRCCCRHPGSSYENSARASLNQLLLMQGRERLRTPAPVELQTRPWQNRSAREKKTPGLPSHTRTVFQTIHRGTKAGRSGWYPAI